MALSDFHDLYDAESAYETWIHHEMAKKETIRRIQLDADLRSAYEEQVARGVPITAMPEAITTHYFRILEVVLNEMENF